MLTIKGLSAAQGPANGAARGILAETKVRRPMLSHMFMLPCL